MNIAIEGCLHGQLQQVYKQLGHLENQLNIKFDLLIICGDFQALRDQEDLDYLHCPPKFKAMGSFYEYFQSEKQAPILTIFIGGNHEAVNYMRGLYFGGWAAKNIYYLGQAGSVLVRKGDSSIRVSGLSGIYNHRDFQYVLRPQRIPLRGSAKISAYHIKQLELFRMELLSRVAQMKKEEPSNFFGPQGQNFDIFLSHDWPKNIAFYGKTSELFRFKPFLEKQINDGTFGSPPSQKLMQLSKPAFWFSAHMHVKYAALYPHSQNQYTHFLALDKCLQKRSCLQALRLEKDEIKSHRLQCEGQSTAEKQKVRIELDLDWLSVLKSTAHLQDKGEVLYKYDQEQNLKLLNSKIMNELILGFKQFRQQIENSTPSDRLPPSFEEDQLKQTEKLIEWLSLDKKQFIGTIFPKGYFEYFEEKADPELPLKQASEEAEQSKAQQSAIIVQEGDDEIDLDL